MQPYICLSLDFFLKPKKRHTSIYHYLNKLSCKKQKQKQQPCFVCVPMKYIIIERLWAQWAHLEITVISDSKYESINVFETKALKLNLWTPW